MRSVNSAISQAVAAFQPDGDRSHHYPALSQARLAVQSQDLEALAQIYRTADSWSLRWAVIEEAAGCGGEAYWRAVAARAPGDPWVLALLAECLVLTGWDVRGSGLGSTVTQAQARLFHEYLLEAEQCLMRACAIDPGFLPPWVTRLKTARGLGVGAGETQRRYAAAAQADPDCWAAQREAMEDFLPKWHGSWEMAFDFARQCSNVAPPGSPTHSIVAEALLAGWAHSDVDSLRDYLADGTIQAEIETAASRSVLNPAFTRQFGWVEALTAFAVVLSSMARWPQAKHCFGMLGPFYWRMPRFFNPDRVERVFLEFRGSAMRLG
ncbi:MAG: hypothetical protein LBL01_02610 [Bifidobacteriaceae bacterium]|jgi:hypothetical protein|nr:hypothetical protein [Bifidobacteriaceae bacterium]